MKRRCFALFVVLLAIVVALLVGCSKGPEADVNINATVIDLYPERSGVRVTDVNGGRKYEVLVTPSTELTYNDETIALDELQHGYQVHLWANAVQGKEFKYEALKIKVIDAGGAAPRR